MWRGDVDRLVSCIFGAAVGAALLAAPAEGAIPGLTGTEFHFVAKEGHLSAPDGNTIYFWGFADAATGIVQYPGPTLLLAENAVVTIELTNELSEPVSLCFPGLTGPTVPTYDAEGRLRSLAPETLPGDTAIYTFTADDPGTYYYQSCTNMDRQVPLGLFGAIIVYPEEGMGQAYDHPDSAYDREYLLLLSEIDIELNEAAELGLPYNSTGWLAVYWFINGRSAPDTMAEHFVGYLPNQPYGAMVRMHPGERILVRFINVGRDPHPIHPHGQHTRVIARDARLLRSSPLSGADLATHQFTVQVGAGQTYDGLYIWTGDDLGFDIYGHDEGDDTEPYEFVPDHGKPLPIQEPPFGQVVFGDFYSGSPFLGRTGLLPPDHPGLNPSGAFVFMWHSHREMEMTTYNDFPGGMMTMAFVEAPGVEIME